MRSSPPPRFLALVLAIGLLVTSACSGEDGPSSTTSATANPVTGGTLDPADPLAYTTFRPPASPQCVALGHRFALELDAAPSEGLRWTVVAPPVQQGVPSGVQLGGSEFVSSSGSGTEATDTTELQRITFAAAELGEVDITVRYVGVDGTPVPGVAEETWPIVVTEDGLCPPPPVTDTTMTDLEG